MSFTQSTPRQCRPFHDLREYLATVKAMGHLKVVEGADTELEIGTLTGSSGRARIVRFYSSMRSKVIRAVCA